jgi:hypothetical protein
MSPQTDSLSTRDLNRFAVLIYDNAGIKLELRTAERMHPSCHV